MLNDAHEPEAASSWFYDGRSIVLLTSTAKWHMKMELDAVLQCTGPNQSKLFFFAGERERCTRAHSRAPSFLDTFFCGKPRYQRPYVNHSLKNSFEVHASNRKWKGSPSAFSPINSTPWSTHLGEIDVESLGYPLVHRPGRRRRGRRREVHACAGDASDANEKPHINVSL